MSGIKVCFISIIFTIIYLFSSVFFSNLFFNNNSNGSLLILNKKVLGSKLIGQEFTSNNYFHSRPSQNNYKNNLSGNSNLSYYSKDLANLVLNNYQSTLKKNLNNKPDLNLITESASGLDPHITYNGALSQADRISKSSSTSKELLIMIINEKSKPLIAGLFGEKIVNVLELNLELNKIYAQTPRP